MTEAIPKGYKQTEIGVIPEDWEVKRLEELNTEKCASLNPQAYKNEIFEYYSIPNYQENKKPSFVKGSTIKSSKVVFKDNMVLFGRLNPRVEKVWLIKSVSNRKMIGSGEWITILPDNINYFSEYIYYLCWSKYIMPIAKENVSGSTPSRQRVIASFFYKIKVPLPSNPQEQSAILQVLSDTDKLIEKLDKLIAKKKNIKKGAMQELLTGKKRLPGFSGEWEEKELGEIGEISGAGIDKKIIPGETPVRLVNFLDVYHKDFIYSNMLNHWVTAPTQKAVRCAVKKGDIFFTPSSEMRDDIGLSAVAMEDIPDATYSYHVTRFRLFDDWDIKFSTYIFNGRFFLNQCETVCEGSGKRYVINMGKFKQLKIRYPKDKKEQEAIGNVLFSIDAEIEALERKRDKYKMIKEGMMQVLLTGRIRLIKSIKANP